MSDVVEAAEAARAVASFATVDFGTVIECAANLVDKPGPAVSEEYLRGVVDLAASICLNSNEVDAVTVMGYAVYGVNKPGGKAL